MSADPSFPTTPLGGTRGRKATIRIFTFSLSLGSLFLPAVSTGQQNHPPPIQSVPPSSLSGHNEILQVSAHGCPPAGESAIAPIGSLPRSVGSYYAFGDTDQDGWNEVYLSVANGFQVLEHIGNNEYATVFQGASLIPLAVGDFDGDNKQELVGLSGPRLRVFESLSSNTFPSEMVWESPPVSNVIGWAQVGDSDRDGNMEVLYTEGFFSGTANLLILEVVGDDAWVLRERLPLSGNSGGGEILVGNFDNDDLIEIVVTGNDGWVHYFESTANDIWQETASDSTGISNAYALAGGFDCDGNGKAEFFVEGNTWSPQVLRTIVLEADENGGLVHRDTLDALPGGAGILDNEIADFDGDGSIEYMMHTIIGARFYQHSYEDQWCWTDSISGISGHYHAFDLNKNGVPEIVFNSFPTSYILEAPGTATSTGPAPQLGLFALPNPTSGTVTIRSTYLLRAETCVVYDIRGRVVSLGKLTSDGCGGRVWDASQLPSGVYFLKLTERTSEAVARIVVRR